MAEGIDQRSSARLQSDSKVKEMRINAENMLKNKANGVVDHSVVRPSIDVSVTSVKQALIACEKGTPEVCQYLLDECNVIYECKVCLNLFRTLVNFVAHKRSFCTLKYNQMRHKDLRECSEMLSNAGTGDAHPTTATVFVTPEDPVETIPPSSSFELKDYSPTIEMMREVGIIKEIENRPLFSQMKKGSRPTIESVADRLKRKIDDTFDADYYAAKHLRLEKMRETTKAVFQTEGIEGSTMGERYLAWQTEKQLATAFVGPTGKVLSPGDASENLSDSGKENNCSTGSRLLKRYCCPEKDCNKTFIFACSVKRHLMTHHKYGNVSAAQSCKTLKTIRCLVDESGKTIKVKSKVSGAPKNYSRSSENCKSAATCPKCLQFFSNKSCVSNHVKHCLGSKMSKTERRRQRELALKKAKCQDNSKKESLKLTSCGVTLEQLSQADIHKWTGIKDFKTMVKLDEVENAINKRTKTENQVITDNDDDSEVSFKASPKNAEAPLIKKELCLLLTPLPLPKERMKAKLKSVALSQKKLTEIEGVPSSVTSYTSSGRSTPMKTSSDDEADIAEDLANDRKGKSNVSSRSQKATPLSNSSNIKRSSKPRKLRALRNYWMESSRHRRS